jgi:hypothetical protein
MVEKKRKRLYVDGKIQGALMIRVTVYWVLCLVAMALALFLWQYFTTPTRLFQTHFNDMLFYYGPAAVVAILLLPIAVFDVLRLSNRFVGPFLRLRGLMRRATRGEHVAPIHFRRGDFWQEFAEEFNTLVARLEELERARKANRTEQMAEQTPVEVTCDSAG